MEHNYINENEIIEKYLFHQLGGKETDAFEEHLLLCNECRQQLSETKEAIALTQYMAMRTSKATIYKKPVKNEKSYTIPWIKLAAGLVITICTAAFLWYIFKKPAPYYVQNNPERLLDHPAHDIITSSEPKGGDTLQNPVIAVHKDDRMEKYKTLNIYENAIQNNLRGENIEILSPVRASWFTKKDTVIFSMKDDPQVIALTILNNSGQIIFEDKVKTPYKLGIKLVKGQYYWEITENDEVIFVSKFSIR